MREIEFNLNENPFINFQSSRYTMSARISVEKMWNWCHEHDKSFFVMSLGCLMNAVNRVPALKRRIINNKVYEFDYLEATTPIMDEKNEIYKEMRVETPQNFDTLNEWHDYVKDLSKSILNGENKGFTVDMEKRDMENIANFSCIPWIDFDSITSCVVTGRQIQPLISWGRINEDKEMTVAITVSHIFVNGRELGYFYEYAQEEFTKLPTRY
ncbi:CatA-like O-acetyltransferase [uncultured Methanobrevibacter sp.]|uniref:CatA-like O-acetyltransferase n=1 Tax=uncultured Methanobrevibacter sp. TaxID=253161 RepID=UPI0025F92282|nr:CatA-like O-acetyltransferase [uncultured Methanobrevibacter sp.]